MRKLKYLKTSNFTRTIKFRRSVIKTVSGLLGKLLRGNQGAGKRPKGPRTRGTFTRGPEGPESGRNMRVRGPEGPEDEQS